MYVNIYVQNHRINYNKMIKNKLVLYYNVDISIIIRTSKIKGSK